ncbi:MAG: hypothetical protein GF355_06170 [Candidatus Eisenbacteria bacterium]|nr:hypothetical protein [Candidatus Eisenbacteria bacterium]
MRALLLLLAVLAGAWCLAACGGAAQKSQQEEPARGKAQEAPPRLQLEFRWTGGIAGFRRELRIMTGGAARAWDHRTGEASALQLEPAVREALGDTLRSVLSTSAGPYRGRAHDDFHFALRFYPQKGDSVVVEGDGTAFPQLYQPLLRRLMDLTHRVLQSGEPLQEEG